jgi:hypothetical protein
MKRAVACAAILIIGSLALAGDHKTTSYGEGVTLAEPVAITALLAEPDDYVGQKVRIDGVITGVCKKRGCWMQVTDPESGQGVRIKVDDGVIVFPYESMGHKASAEGVFEAIPLTPEQVAARAEGAGHSHDADGNCVKGTGAKAGCDAPVHDDTIYLLRGTGAEIQS